MEDPQENDEDGLDAGGIDARQYGGQTPASQRRQPARQAQTAGRSQPVKQAQAGQPAKQRSLDEHARQLAARKSASRVPLKQKASDGITVTDPAELELIARLRSKRLADERARREAEMRPKLPDIVETDPGWESTGRMVESQANRRPLTVQPAEDEALSKEDTYPDGMDRDNALTGMDPDERAAVEAIRSKKRRMTEHVDYAGTSNGKQPVINGIAGLLYLLGGSFAGIASTGVRPIVPGDEMLYAGIGAAAAAAGFVFQNFLGTKLR